MKRLEDRDDPPLANRRDLAENHWLDSLAWIEQAESAVNAAVAELLKAREYASTCAESYRQLQLGAPE